MGIENGEIQAYISPLSILEVLIKPKREKNEFLENMYKILLNNSLLLYPSKTSINLYSSFISV